MGIGQVISDTFGVVKERFGTLLGLWAVRQQPVSYADLVHLDPVMLATTFVLAIVASVLAGLVPAWHACQVTPAMQLKSQ